VRELRLGQPAGPVAQRGQVQPVRRDKGWLDLVVERPQVGLLAVDLAQRGDERPVVDDELLAELDGNSSCQ